MRVISIKQLRAFWQRHPDAEVSLRVWYKIAVDANWSNLSDVRRTFPHADGLVTPQGEVLTVFNIAGNKYRLITRIRYDYSLINVREVLTHAQHSKGHWKR